MRVVSRSISLKKIVSSKIFLFLLALGLAYMLFLNYRTWSFLLLMNERLQLSKTEYSIAQQKLVKSEIAEFESESEDAKLRYKKEFFNHLEEGEHVVFLHRTSNPKKEEEVRQLSLWEKYSQRFLLWWKNL